MRSGQHPVQPEPHPTHRVAGLREVDRGGGVGGVEQLGVNLCLSEFVDELEHRLVLFKREGRIGVGDRKVREQPLEGETVVVVNAASDLERLDGPRTDAVHASIELEVDRVRDRSRRFRSLCECVDELDPIRGGSKGIGHDDVDLVERRLGEHEDRSVDIGLPQSDAFLDEGDGEKLGATAHRSLRHGDIPMPVRVGLHHGTQGCRCDVRGEQLGIVLDRVKVDFDPGRAHTAPDSG